MLTAKSASADERLGDFREIQEWLDSGANRVFRTRASFEWWCRKADHRKRLVASGQLIKRGGPAPDLVGPGIDRVVLEVLRDENRNGVAS